MINRAIWRSMQGAFSQRFMSISQKTKDFPYTFNKHATQREPGKAASSYYKNTFEWIGSTYKKLLLAIEQDEVDFLGKSLERRLLRRINKEVKALKDEGYSFVVHNKDSPVDMVLEDAGRIIGGYIDRDTEYKEGIAYVPFKSTPFPPYSVIAFYLRHIKKDLDVIDKLNIKLYTACKLGLKAPNGEMLPVKEEIPLEEVHDLQVEGIAHVLNIELSFKGVFQNTKKLSSPPPNDLTELRIVDLDNALKGNLHKDNKYL